MRRLAIAFLLGIVIGLSIAQPANGARLCDRRPSHPKCQPAPTAQPSPTTPSQFGLSFGLGSQTESAIRSRLTADAPIRILSNWHAKPADTAWMTDAYHRSIYADAKARGYKLHLITWTDLPETTFDGMCGRAFPLSAGWLDDMRAVAEAMQPDYVTLFTEFQTYTCTDNAWSGNEPYWQALIAQYERAVPVFRAYGKVSIGWGGWQLQTDRSLDGPFLGVTEDFHSFQAMHGVSNVADIRGMTKFLGPGTMLAHHMPDADTNDPATVYATFEEDWRTLATDASIAALVADGLFAWSVVDDIGWSSDADTYALVRDAMGRYGR